MTGGRVATTQVQQYYDRHTDTFVAYGQGGSIGAIHRAVWGPGVETRQQAFRYVENTIVDHVRTLEPDDGFHVVDLGCGIGSSLCYVAERVPIRGTGVTLSPKQAALGVQRIDDAGLADRLRCVEGDYCDLPGDVGPADVAYAIESFVHGPDPRRFFEQCARLVRPGGKLLICDDFRRAAVQESAESAIARFRRGWHVNTLLHQEELEALAREAGFDHEDTLDLTQYLEIGRPRDRMIALLVTLVGWIPAVATRYDYLIGGSALQTCLRNGWIGYDLASFRRQAG